MSDSSVISIADNGRANGSVFGLNLVRAFAILYVLFDHTYPIPFDTPADLPGLFLGRCMTSPDACIFFMLSGALLLPVSGRYSLFLKKRFFRILWPFIFWSIVYALLRYIYRTGDPGFMIFQIKWCLLTPTFGPGWFIPALISLYLFFPIISPWIRSAAKRQIEYFILLWMASGLLLPMHVYMGVDDFSGTIFGMFYNYLGYAIAGYYLVRYPLSKQNPRRSATLISVTTIIGIALPAFFIFAGFNFDAPKIFSEELTTNTMALGCLLFMTLSKVRTLGKIGDRIVNLIAKNAFGIYLCHAVLQDYLFKIYIPELYGTALGIIALPIASLTLIVLIRQIPFAGRYVV